MQKIFQIVSGIVVYMGKLFMHLSRKIYGSKKALIITSSIVVLIIIGILIKVSFGSKFSTQGNVSRPLPRVNMVSSIIISGNGDLRVAGVNVESVNGNVITATSTINNKPFTVTITADKHTTIFLMNATSSLSKISPGVVLYVTGSLENFSPNLSLIAKEIRIMGIGGSLLVNTNSTSGAAIKSASTTKKIVPAAGKPTTTNKRATSTTIKQ